MPICVARYIITLSCCEIKDFKNIKSHIIFKYFIDEQLNQNRLFALEINNPSKPFKNVVFDCDTEEIHKLFGFTQKDVLKAVKFLQKQKLIKCMWSNKNSLVDLKISTTQEMGA